MHTRHRKHWTKTEFASSNVKSYSVTGQSENPVDLQIPEVDLHVLQAREEAAIRQAETEAERIGVGVTVEAQDIFDALSKTLPVRWDKSAIVVMDEVRVSSPYQPDNVVGGSAAANDRVKKVVSEHTDALKPIPPYCSSSLGDEDLLITSMYVHDIRVGGLENHTKVAEVHIGSHLKILCSCFLYKILIAPVQSYIL
eukprot:jgi/Mesen1/6308/ME000325S05438